MMLRGLTIAAAALAGAIVLASLANAQQQPGFDFQACEGDISSLALGDIPDGDAFTVDIFDPTDTALKFRRIFLAALTEAAKRTADNGNLVFSFRAESIFRGMTPRQEVDPTFRGSRDSTGSTRARDEDETRELIRRDRAARDDRSPARQQILVEVELRNKSTQRVVWLATVRCDPLTNDQNLLMQFVSQAIVANIGQALRQKPI